MIENIILIILGILGVVFLTIIPAIIIGVFIIIWGWETHDD